MQEKEMDQLEEPQEESTPVFPFNVLAFVINNKKKEDRDICFESKNEQKYHLLSYIDDIPIFEIDEGLRKEKKIQSLLEQMEKIYTIYYQTPLCEECLKTTLYKAVGKVIGRTILRQYKACPTNEKAIAIGYTFCRPEDKGHLFALVLGDKIYSQEHIFDFIRNEFHIPPFIQCE